MPGKKGKKGANKQKPCAGKKKGALGTENQDDEASLVIVPNTEPQPDAADSHKRGPSQHPTASKDSSPVPKDSTSLPTIVPPAIANNKEPSPPLAEEFVVKSLATEKLSFPTEYLELGFIDGDGAPFELVKNDCFGRYSYRVRNFEERLQYRILKSTHKPALMLVSSNR
jgi:hypothetical protein